MYSDLQIQAALEHRKKYYEMQEKYYEIQEIENDESDLLIKIQCSFCSKKIKTPTTKKYSLEFILALEKNGIECTKDNDNYIFTLPKLEDINESI